ncbi:MAG: hypothetical protein ABJE95_32570 [Byssovorax sp.]
MRVPLEVIDRVLPELAADGCIELRDRALVIRNFIEAQEARQSDRARQKASRERARAALAPVTNRDTQSQNVTGESRDVTERHTMSHDVTRGHSQLSSAQLSQKEDPGSASNEPDGSRSSPRFPDGSPDPAKPFTNPNPEPRAPEALQIATSADASSTVFAAKAGRRQEADQTIALPLAGIDAPNPRNDVEEVFAVYLDGWRRGTIGTRNPKLDEKRRRLILARLKDFSLDDLKLAARGAWLDDWHVTKGHNKPEQVFRDMGRVEQFMGFATAVAASSPRSGDALKPYRPVAAVRPLAPFESAV